MQLRGKYVRRLILAAFILSITVAATAQTRKFEDWSVVDGSDNSGDAVAVTSAGAEVLAVRCYAETQKCIHVLKTQTDCEKDSTIPMLVAGRSGSAHINGYCFDGGQLMISPFDTVRRAFDEGTAITAIAFALESGSFRVLRFSTNGYKAAVAEAERRAQKRGSKKPGASTL